MKTINTITFILAATLIFHFNAISGSFNSSPASEKNMITLAPSTPDEATFEEFNTDLSFFDVTAFAPVTPDEADFNDGVPVADANMINLAPVTPAEADFNDEAPEAGFNLSSVAPVTPAEADFNETTEMNAGLSSLAPVTPAEADFE